MKKIYVYDIHLFMYHEAVKSIQNCRTEALGERANERKINECENAACTI